MKKVTVTHKFLDTAPVTMYLSVWSALSSEIQSNYTVEVKNG